MLPKNLSSPRAQKAFRRALLDWYHTHKRDLPWRHSTEPYPVWISEIMLQQTRVVAVLDHYLRFLRRFPDVKALATAEETEVLAQWSGMGYYRRARFMHEAAHAIAYEHDGVFPQSFEELRKLPGIGRYTAAAIASICFLEPVAVVDGNVARVLHRLCGKPPKDPWQAASVLLDPAGPGDFNQAMMELGARVCLPAEPQCKECPVRRYCRTRGRTPSLKKKPPIRHKSVWYRLSIDSDTVLMQQRSSRASLMPGMWELPSQPAVRQSSLRLRHSITNTNYEVQVVRAPARQLRENQHWVAIRRLSTLPLTGLARKILSRLGLL